MNPAVLVAVDRISFAPAGGKVLAVGWVRLTGGPLTILTGPWRIVASESGRPRIFPPSTRLDGVWTDCIRPDRDTLMAIGDALTEAFARAKFPDLETKAGGRG
jgi:hypothetical protein